MATDDSQVINGVKMPRLADCVAEVFNGTFGVCALLGALCLVALHGKPNVFIHLSVLVAAVYALKLSTARMRPDGSDSMSFPSGHAALSWFMASSLALSTRASPLACITAALWASLVGFSRVHAQRHHLQDVIAGALLGAVGALMALPKSESLISMSPGASPE
jgi:membrane-associated phospholipid phosphatase